MEEQGGRRNNMDDATAVPNLVRKLDDELEKFPHTRSAEAKRWGTQSIFRIPHSLKEQNGSSSYRPQTVSIGPYHHGEPHLDSMEEHMLHYFNNLVGLSIIGAVSIFALAATQTHYTVLGYYHPKQ